MVPTTVDTRHLDRLPADDLHKVTAEHVWNAVQRLSTEAVAHAFGESREFDLLGERGVRLPPKAVFGLAATEALGFEVLPKHFSGGIGTPCFRILEDAGFEIVRKGEASQAIVAPPTDDGEESHLMSQGDEFKFQRGAATNAEQEQKGTEGGQ